MESYDNWFHNNWSFATDAPLLGTLLNPLLMMSVMAIVFASLLKIDLKSFAVFLFTGMIPWNFFSAAVTQSSTSFINNEGLIKKIYIPKIVFPASIAIALLIDSLLSFVALFVIILALGSPLTWLIIFMPVAYLLLFGFTFGISLVFSVVTVFFRDLQHILLIGIQGLFFLTPIFYKQDALVGRAGEIVNLNPLSPFIAFFRDILYDAEIPDLNLLLKTSVIAMVSLIIGFWVFLSQENKIVFRL